MRAACGEAHIKVILGTGDLATLRNVTLASMVAMMAGADFVKTSTGKTRVSATPEAAHTMLEVVRAAPRPVGLKPSGGIRTLERAGVYVGLADQVMGPGWATPATFRLGASSLLADVLARLAVQ